MEEEYIFLEEIQGTYNPENPGAEYTLTIQVYAVNDKIVRVFTHPAPQYFGWTAGFSKARFDNPEEAIKRMIQ